MSTASLSATARTTSGKGAARSLRRDGQIPAVIYGHSREPQSLAINERELARLLDRVTAATVIELTVDGKTSRALIREIQRHPVKRNVLHLDFQEVVAGEKVTVDVPLIYRGTPAGVREGGILDQILHALSISADPASIPNTIEVDVSGLAIGHPLHVRDLPVPSGVVVLNDADATIAVVSAPKTATETAAEGASAEPELIRKPKPEEGK